MKVIPSISIVLVLLVACSCNKDTLLDKVIGNYDCEVMHSGYSLVVNDSVFQQSYTYYTYETLKVHKSGDREISVLNYTFSLDSDYYYSEHDQNYYIDFKDFTENDSISFSHGFLGLGGGYSTSYFGLKID